MTHKTQFYAERLERYKSLALGYSKQAEEAHREERKKLRDLESDCMIAVETYSHLLTCPYRHTVKNDGRKYCPEYGNEN